MCSSVAVVWGQRRRAWRRLAEVGDAGCASPTAAVPLAPNL